MTDHLPPDPSNQTPSIPGPVRPTRGGAPAANPGVRTRPAAARAPRLPGTYAANHGDGDMDWRRGVGALWTFFTLAAVGELVRAVFYMLAGYADWPLLPDLARVSIGAAGFAALWLGWGWTRWVLAVTDFLFGAWLIINVAAGQPSGEPTIVALPKLALGILYVCRAGYLAFSADVVDFARHRREEGRGWVAGPVCLLLAVYVAAIVLAQAPFAFFLGLEALPAKRFGDETLHAMCDHWDADALSAEGDAKFRATWPNANLKRALASLSPLGEMKDPGDPHVEVDHTAVDTSGHWFVMRYRYGGERPSSDQGHGQSKGVSIKINGSATDETGGGFLLQYTYNRAQVDFAHGHAQLGFALTKHPFGAWRLNNFVVYDIHFDPAASPTDPPPRAGG